ASGADPALTEPNGEMGFFTQSDPEWQQNHGSPRDPQPGNNPGGNYDDPGSPEDDTQLKPLQTSAGSTPTGHPPIRGKKGTASIELVKAINALDPLHPTPAEDANDRNNPRPLPIGANVVWTYLLTNTGTQSLTIDSFTDDAGTQGVLGDDFTPKFVSGDTN